MGEIEQNFGQRIRPVSGGGEGEQSQKGGGSEVERGKEFGRDKRNAKEKRSKVP